MGEMANCSKLERFAKGLSDFSYCSLIYTVPYNLCRKCRTEYDYLFEVYSSLTSGEESGNGTCPEDILSGDKLRNINGYFTHTRSVWALGNCDSELINP